VGGQLKDCSDFNVLHEEVKGDRFKNKDVPTVASCLHMDAGSTSTEQHEHSYVHQLEASINCLSCYHQSFSLQLLVSQPTSMLEEAQWSPILYFLKHSSIKGGWLVGSRIGISMCFSPGTVSLSILSIVPVSSYEEFFKNYIHVHIVIPDKNYFLQPMF